MPHWIIVTEDDDGVPHFWGDRWVKDQAAASHYPTEDAAQDHIEHMQSVAFGPKTDNARTAKVLP